MMIDCHFNFTTALPVHSFFFFFQAEDGIRDLYVTGVQTCALPICDTGPMTPTPILLDCDPGHDDAIALLLALASPELELLGVTTVSGNQTLDKTTANAIRVLEFVGRGDVPVAAGADAPLARERYVAAYVHGESGLEGPDLPPPRGAPVGQHAVDFLAERILASPRPVT